MGVPEEELVRIRIADSQSNAAIEAVKLSKVFDIITNPEPFNRDWPIEEKTPTGFHAKRFYKDEGKVQYLVFVTGLKNIFLVTLEADTAKVQLVTQEHEESNSWKAN